VDTKRDELYKLKETVRKQLSPSASPEELVRVNAYLARARAEKNELVVKLKTFDDDEVTSYGFLLMHSNAYLKSKRGRLERILEPILTAYPI
jgi:hypothetical protein